MLKINILLIGLLSLCNGYHVKENASKPNDFEPELRILLQPFVDQTLVFARPDSDLVYLNLHIKRKPRPYDRIILPHDDGRHVYVTFNNYDAQWLNLCEERGTDGLRIRRFRAGGHTIDVDVFCADQRVIWLPPPGFKLSWHHKGSLIFAGINGSDASI